MSDATQGISKVDAIQEIERQIREGRDLLSLPIGGHEDMALANGRRASWTLRNRKLFYNLFSDSSILARPGRPVALEDDEGGDPGLAPEVAEFRQVVTDQLACMAKVVGFLRKLA